ncbi:hypothetical protein HAX54_051097 [Datura stramonium]|uniref:Uncharacterized protein n=1 Tax=Datura stramonium TaxID=4076 RepID=A0ABS8WM16_DATST|nr:hypothetical protein [Datura stramonium]
MGRVSRRVGQHLNDKAYLRLRWTYGRRRSPTRNSSKCRWIRQKFQRDVADDTQSWSMGILESLKMDLGFHFHVTLRIDRIKQCATVPG